MGLSRYLHRIACVVEISFPGMSGSLSQCPLMTLSVDDTLIPGSTTRFSGLAAAMQDRDVCALCVFVKSERSEPRLVSLVPLSYQCHSLGLAMIELPYCDDIRHPEERAEFLGAPVPSDEHVIDLASKIIQEFQLTSQYVPGGIQNPQVKRHFTVLESLATGVDWDDESLLPQLDKEMLLAQDERKENLLASFAVRLYGLIIMFDDCRYFLAYHPVHDLVTAKLSLPCKVRSLADH